MCKAVDDYAREPAKGYAEERAKELVKEHTIEETVKIVKNMLEGGISIETALKCSNINLQTYEKYSKKIQ